MKCTSYNAKLIHIYFHRFGIDGKACLLRTICEVNATPMGENNGVFGDMLQIILVLSIKNLLHHFMNL